MEVLAHINIFQVRRIEWTAHVPSWNIWQHMRDLHTRLAEVNRKYGHDRGDDIHETGARHRSTAEYNRDLHRENARLETLIDDNREQLRQLEDEIRKSERRVKGLTTMITNLERQETELNDEIARLESDIENGAGDVSELRCRIAELETRMMKTTAASPTAA